MQSVGRGWELFADVVPDDVAAPVFAILDRPGLLARRLDGCETASTGGSGRETTTAKINAIVRNDMVKGATENRAA